MKKKKYIKPETVVINVPEPRLNLLVETRLRVLDRTGMTTNNPALNPEYNITIKIDRGALQPGEEITAKPNSLWDEDP